jgi:hypothetical protein
MSPDKKRKPAITSRLSPEQAAAISKTEEFAELLCDGKLESLALEIKNYLLEGIGTIPQAVARFNIQETYAPSADPKSIENALRLFVNQTFTLEELSIYKSHTKTSRRQRMQIINQLHAEEINRARQAPETRKKRAIQAKETWNNRDEEERERWLAEMTERARKKSISLGGFDSKNPEQMEFFLNQCKEVIHANGKPDFNQIAINMNSQFGINKSRKYWGYKYFQLRQKGEH